MKIGIIYGSTTGDTEEAAEIIQEHLAEAGEVTLANILDTPLPELEEYDVLILGASTWGVGDIQDDWMGKDSFSDIDLSGKKIAVFGTGDQEAYCDTFVDAIGILHEAAERAGATLLGAWPTEGYDYEDSAAVRNGKFGGLALDYNNQPELSNERIAAWCDQIKGEMVS